MTLGQLLDLHVNGALKIKYEDGENTAVLGDSTRITLEQAQQLCYKFGWTEFYLNAFEIIAKTNSMMSSFKKSAMGTNWEPEFWNYINVEFQNKRAATYGKTFDRIVLYIKGNKYTILHGMEHTGAAYVVYVNGSAIPSAKCRTLNKVAEYLVTTV